MDGDSSPPSDIAGPAVQRSTLDTRYRDARIRRRQLGRRCRRDHGARGDFDPLLHTPPQLCSPPLRTTTAKQLRRRRVSSAIITTISQQPSLVFSRFFFRSPRGYATNAPVPYTPASRVLAAVLPQRRCQARRFNSLAPLHALAEPFVSDAERCQRRGRRAPDFDGSLVFAPGLFVLECSRCSSLISCFVSLHSNSILYP